jgi:hypothetical protein
MLHQVRPRYGGAQSVDLMPFYTGVVSIIGQRIKQTGSGHCDDNNELRFIASRPYLNHATVWKDWLKPLSAPVGGAAYTIDAAPGAYVLTGAVAKTAAGRSVNAALRAFTVSGSVAGTIAGRVVKADPQAFALTGFGAQTVAGRVVRADPRAFAVTGSVAGTLAGRAINAATRAFVVASPDVGLEGPATGYEAAILDLGPQAYYRFGESSGTVAEDDTGALDATYEGGFTLGAAGGLVGDADTAVTLDGSTGRVNIGDNFDFAGTASFSFAVWVRCTIPAPLNAARILSKEDQTTGSGYELRASSAGVIFERGEATGDNDDATDTNPLVEDAWTFLVAVHDGTSGDLYLYRDGVEVATVPTTNAPSIPGNATNLYVGVRPDLARRFEGDVDELAIFDYVLDAQTIADLYAIGTGVAAYELNAQPGSLAVTGATARTVADRVVNAQPRVLALTGSEARTVAGRVITGSPRAFVISGTVADLVLTTVEKMLNAAPGTFAITGANAPVVAGRVVNAQPGLFEAGAGGGEETHGHDLFGSFGGVDPNTKHVGRLNVPAGTIVRIGAADVNEGWIEKDLQTPVVHGGGDVWIGFQLDTGSAQARLLLYGDNADRTLLPLLGQSDSFAPGGNSFKYDPTLHGTVQRLRAPDTYSDGPEDPFGASDVEGNERISVRAVVEVGVEARLIASRLITASPRAFVLTGAQARVVADRAVNSAPGAFVVTGVPADLVFSAGVGFTLNAQPGAIAAIGVDARVVAGRALAASPRLFVFTGMPTKTVAGRVVNAAPRVFTITGVVANLVFKTGFILVASPRAISVTGAVAKTVATRKITASPRAFAVTGISTGLFVNVFWFDPYAPGTLGGGPAGTDAPVLSPQVPGALGGGPATTDSVGASAQAPGVITATPSTTDSH